jgi:two-component system, OmpR family, response regulator
MSAGKYRGLNDSDAIERPTNVCVAFGRWTLQGDGRLIRDGVDVQLPPKECHVLHLLLASVGALVTKDRLLELAWPHSEATEESLTRCIYSLRKYLKDDKGFIKTIYGKGYRFTCPSAIPEVLGAAHTVLPTVHVCSVCGQVSQWES